MVAQSDRERKSEAGEPQDYRERTCCPMVLAPDTRSNECMSCTADELLATQPATLIARLRSAAMRQNGETFMSEGFEPGNWHVVSKTGLVFSNTCRN